MSNFAPFNLAQIQSNVAAIKGQRTENALLGRKNQREQLLLDAGKASGGDKNLYFKTIRDADPLLADEVEAEDMDRTVKGLDFIRRTAPLVTNQQSYDRWGMASEKIGVTAPGERPRLLDEPDENSGMTGREWMSLLNDKAEERWMTLTADQVPGGIPGHVYRAPVKGGQLGKIEKLDEPDRAATQINLPSGPSEMDKKTAEGVHGRYDKTLAGAEMAQSTLADIDAYADLLDGVDTGKYKTSIQELKRAGSTLGIDMASLGIDRDMDRTEAARQLAARFALRMRNPESGFGMPGSLAVAELQWLLNSNPGLEQSPAGRKLMVNFVRNTALAQIELGEYAADLQASGKMGVGFDKQMFDKRLELQKRLRGELKAQRDANNKVAPLRATPQANPGYIQVPAMPDDE